MGILALKYIGKETFDQAKEDPKNYECDQCSYDSTESLTVEESDDYVESLDDKDGNSATLDEASNSKDVSANETEGINSTIKRSEETKRTTETEETVEKEENTESPKNNLLDEVDENADASNKSNTDCLNCNKLAAHKISLEEKLALSNAAYSDTKKNLELSDSEIAESSNTIEELNNAIKTLEANTDIGKLAEKDDKIR